MHKTKVIISFDTEFSIGGAFQFPEKYNPLADEIFKPTFQNKEIGFGNVIEILNKNNVQCTFFVEPLQSYYFGHEKMGCYVKQLSDSKQDVQLHTHPCWGEFKYKKKVPKAICPDDSFCQLSESTVREHLSYCQNIFKRWEVKFPTAIRTGNLEISRNLYKLLCEFDIKLSSSVGTALFKPVDKEMQFENYNKIFDSVLEVPVTSFKSIGNRKKLLTITSVSFREIKDVLEACHKAGIEHVIILSHIHEFVKNKNFRFEQVRPNKVNSKRLEQLCCYVNQDKRFSFTTFGEEIENNAFSVPDEKLDKCISSNAFSGIYTILENKANDKLWNY